MSNTSCSVTALMLITALIGLCLGSFLTVVIERLPRMMARQWRSDARAILELEPVHESRLSLALPGSHCPQCRHAIAWHDNLPLIGWLKRCGRCAHCRAPISLLYPATEVSAATLVVILIHIHGLTLSGLMLSAAALALLALAMIDMRTQLLPDIITLPLLWGGLAYQLLCAPEMLDSAVIGAMAGYGILWVLAGVFQLVLGRQAMGNGDFKLLAALGAWLGWEMLPLTLLLAAGSGALFGLLSQTLIPRLRGQPLPFGPWLALAGWCGLIAGDTLMAGYLALLQP